MIFTEKKRTILRAVINTLESGELEGVVDRAHVLGFFQAVDRVFHLEYGKVLLAVSSRNQLEDMLERGLPYFANHMEEVRSCLGGSGCEGVGKVVESLGKTVRE